MYSVLLVDDEDIEREAMAAIIPWEEVGMELVDVAWNGIEGLEKICLQKPDIVITDIKMPVMNGIELVRKVQGLYPHIAFVILSGYGDYEYTSQAMELGIRHYILKPCNEHKIVEVLLNVKQDLLMRAEKQKSEQEMQKNIQRMLPHLKEQILYELLTKKELSLSDQDLLKNFTKNLANDFILLSVRSPVEFDQLDRFTLTNILTELLEDEYIYAGTAFQKELVYLIPASSKTELSVLIKKTHEEYSKYKNIRLNSAVSQRGCIEESYRLYQQIKELFYFEELNGDDEYFEYNMYQRKSGAIPFKVNYEGIRNAKRYEELLFELYCSYAVLLAEERTDEKIWEIYNFSLKVLFGEEIQELEKCEDTGILLEQMVELCAQEMNLGLPDAKDGERIKAILYAIFRNLKNPELTLQYLASEVLFMNEDYFGRFFSRYMCEKYSSYLIRIRIQLAQRLLQYFPEMRISELAKQVGFPPDGQYLSKVFKKKTGILLSDYRKSVYTRQ